MSSFFFFISLPEINLTYFAIVSQTRMTAVLKEFEVQGGGVGTDTLTQTNKQTKK